MLENIRYTLEKARTALGNGWTKGDFFVQGLDDSKGQQGFSVCLAGGVMAALDLVNSDEDALWKNASARAAIEALYNNIPRRSPARRASDQGLTWHASELEHHDPDLHIQEQMREYAAEWNISSTDPVTVPYYQGMFEMLAAEFDLPDRSEGECKVCYGTMLGAITTWNDTESRRKNEVLDLVDASIKDVIRKSEIV